MRFEGLFFDVDGTLKGFASGRIPPSAVRALHAAHERGVRLFVVSGRQQGQIARAVEGLPFDGYVACNGACCFDAEWRPLASATLPPDDIGRLVGLLARGGGPTVTFMYGDRVAASRADAAVEDFMRRCGVEPPVVEDPHRALGEPLYQASLFVGVDEERRLMAEVLPGCMANRWHPAFVDVNLRGCDKRSGMERLMEHFGIRRERTMAFGDGGNDKTIIAAAGVGIAMGNATDEVKAVADYVTTSVDDDGIRNALKHFNII